MTLLQDGAIFTSMALAGGHEPQAAVVVDLVVPVHKPGYPGARLVKVFEGLVREVWTVFQGLEQGFGVGVVITDRGPTERGHDPELLQGSQHGRALHR